ncbi:MAG: bifunctional DNA-formamidopyrimidine glycosylase/DNA-(apurinic or apyrimidinic site) lyase [Chloroflexi bacterium]|nr:bifunctional DNA-formamidopyrimidine glycosylase/DNA-(apurinic or apyrimidinic site) lyase [Chloroflexota bacterium]
MPELPEVETIARNLHPALAGRTVRDARLLWRNTLAAPSPAIFKRQVMGQEIRGVERRAKFIHIRLSSTNLIIHLRMSGDLLAVIGGYEPARHDRLILDLSDDMTLVFTDPRKFGRAWLVDDPQTFFTRLGPEPLSDDFTPSVLFTALQEHKRALKPLLLDQAFLAGVGNIYADEALHLAQLHPRMPSNQVSESQAAALWQAVRETLAEGIRRNGASIDWVYRGGQYQDHFRVYQRTGQPCPVCGTPIQRLTVGQRGAHICPACQPLTG